MFANKRGTVTEGFNDLYLTEQPVSIIATNIGSFMGGKHHPWNDGKTNATSIFQTTTDPNITVDLTPKSLEVREPSKNDGFIEFTSANSILGMSLGVFHRVG